MNLIYENNEKEWAKGIDTANGVNWVIWESEPRMSRGEFKIPEYFVKELMEIRDHLNDDARTHKLNLRWEPKKMEQKEIELTARNLENEEEEEEMVAINLEDHIHYRLRRLIKNFENEMQERYDDRFTINIDCSDVSVEVNVVDMPKDKKSKEIEEVLVELNRIYKGQYRFDCTSEL